VLRDPAAALGGHAERLGTLRGRIDQAITGRLREEELGLRHTIERVRALSPRATLLRGYAIVSDPDGDTVDRVAATSVGASLQVRLADGSLGVTVTRATGDTPGSQQPPGHAGSTHE